MTQSLSLSTFARLPLAIRPHYDPAALRAGIVHIGTGAFHRAHQAVYTEEALAADYGDWGIIGASLRQPGVGDTLRAQDSLYSVLTRSAAGSGVRVIACLRDVIHTPSDPQRLPALIASPQIRLVSLTVTEKGYGLDPATRSLDFTHPDIAQDLRAPHLPASTVGTLFAGLHARRLAHGQPLTVLCCDNLQHNGRLLRQLVLAFAEQVDGATARWIESRVAFPDTMVDRIVPATTPATLDEVEERLGLRDAAAVWGEPFMQWVIEDAFAGERPRWEAGGAQFVSDVKPYEDMKLRLLNSSNSLLAYLGYLGGCDYVYQAIALPGYAQLVRRFMQEEAAPTLSMPAEQDLGAYQAQLIERFGNTALPHRCHQIAMDGSQKLPQRFLAVVRDNLAAGRPVRLSALAVAAWMRYVGGADENGRPIAVQDPLAQQLQAAAQGSAADIVDRVLGMRSIFGEDLPRSERFRGELVAALQRLQQVGSRAAVMEYVTA
ncbi:mannitol dehydrogenase family protein [Noviherbaspirillum aerium]|uniref:mannitol dehydrogenase family protein n=1 Tax=Noviherbaspirillum aerium TaxID=2588497 RepID=UPI00124EBCF9|nr:mannitol dehydrogenase family protein [Noviherbaspirillum aerium]